MKIKDSTIIILLILTWIFLLCVMLGTENEINNITELLERIEVRQEEQANSINELSNSKDELVIRVNELEQVNRVQDLRLDIHRSQLDNSVDMFEQVLADMDELEDKINSLPTNVLGLELTESDIRDISALVYLESGSGSVELQRAIASVIFNRMIRYNMTAHQVIYQRGVFSPASRVARTIPSQTSIDAVRYVMQNGCTIPGNVLAFQLGGYHSFGRPYRRIDRVYFTAM